jgi:ketosteroid isomerase-like protein
MLTAEDLVLIDRRSMAIYGELRGRQAARETFISSLTGVRDPQLTVHEVLACDETVVAALVAWSGVGYKGAAFENQMGEVAVIRDGRQASVDLYDPDDRQAMIARYVELGGGLSALGDSPVERFAAEFYTRQARRELEPLQELIDERYLQVDHRSVGWEPVRGRGEHAALFTSIGSANRDLRVEVDEVLAVSERVLAMRIRWVGHGSRAGAFEVPVGQVVLVEDGRLVSVDQYDPDDRAAMLARCAELDG